MQLTRAVLRTTTLYVVFAALWIIFSDKFLGSFQTFKGLAFVAITAVLLYSLIKSQVKSVYYSESRLRAVFDSITDGLMIVDTRPHIIDVNDTALRLFGYAPGHKEMLMRPLGDIVRDFDIRDVSGKQLKQEEYASFRALQGQTVRSMEATLHLPDKRTLELDISAAPILSQDAGIRGAAMVLRDVTEIKRLHRLRDEFLSTAAHEFKTPLAVIKANAQLLQSAGGKWNEEKKSFALKMIDRQCLKANRLVQDLLMGSRMETAALPIRKSRFDIAELAAELVQSMQQMSPKHQVTFARPAGGVSTAVEGDRPRIEQVILNLIENAIKYSPSGGEVSVKVYREGPRIWTSVKDPGIGIQKEKQGDVFKKFYNAHAGTSHDYGGMGIGLSLSKQTVLRHGGTIEFESQVNKGSTFRFSLPAAQEVSDERIA